MTSCWSLMMFELNSVARESSVVTEVLIVTQRSIDSSLLSKAAWSVNRLSILPGECVATQHRLVVMEMNVEMTRNPRPRIKQQKTKWRKLEKDEFKLIFLLKPLQILASVTPEMNYE